MRKLVGGRSVRKKPEMHGESRSPLYRRWWGMIARCEYGSPGHENYKNRGICVCAEWRESYLAFRDWASRNGCLPGLQIDRINNDGDYCPSNCRFVTPSENRRNTARVQMVEIFGESKLLQDWSQDTRCNVPPSTFWTRLHRGWSPKQAMLIRPNTIIGTFSVRERIRYYEPKEDREARS
jgi:hypothetical protein